MGYGLELRDVSKRYGVAPSDVVALDHVDLSVQPAGVVAVMGPSGSGKSTLLHVVGAMDRPDDGSITVGDRKITGLSRREQASYRQTIGFVFQGFLLLPALTALDNVVAPVLPYRVNFDKFQRARQLLASVGLGGRERALPSNLSGGEQQRVAIARALINSPGLLLADEPTGNLDSDTSAEIMDILLSLRAERGMTVIVATHDPVVATRGDRIVRLHDGAVLNDDEVLQGEADETLARITRLDPGQQG